MKYIGGDIEYEGPFTEKNKYKERLDDYLFFSTGRTALYYILKSYKEVKNVLLPSYLCTSILQPFDDLHVNYEFYRVDLNLDIDETDVKKKLDSGHFDALLFINYFGFINSNHLSNIKSDFSDLLFIEDNTHLTFISEILNNYKPVGDIVFGSLRKMLGITDGAFVKKNDRLLSNNFENKPTDFYIYRNLSKIMRREYLQFNKQIEDIEKTYLDLLKKSEDELYDKIPLTSISKESWETLHSMDIEEIAQKRRSNLRYLDKLLRNSNLSEHFIFFDKNIEQNPVPYIYPVLLPDKRDELRMKLLEFGIFTPVIWEIPEEYRKYTEFEDAMKISDSIICFPIDQRYDRNDMKRIKESVESILL